MSHRSLPAILCAVALLTACHSAAVRAVVRSTPEQVLASTARVEFVTADGVTIVGHYHAALSQAVRRPALLLLHGGNRRKERWEETGFVADLVHGDYHMLAIDLRGRGESGGGDAAALRADPTLALADVEAALAWLRAQPDVDPMRIALVGSSYGANLATAGVMARGWPVRTLVCLSATAAAYRFLELHPQAHEIPSGLYLACDAEPVRYDAAATAERLVGATAGESRVEIFAGQVHALGLYLYCDPVAGIVRAWLAARFSE